MNRMISPFLTQRTRSKFVFAGPSKSAETLLRLVHKNINLSSFVLSEYVINVVKRHRVYAMPSFRYIAAEQVPVKYGGLSKDGEFDTTDAVTEITVKPAAKHTVEFPVTEVGLPFSLLTHSGSFQKTFFGIQRKKKT